MASGYTYEIRLKDLATKGFQKLAKSSSAFHNKYTKGQKAAQNQTKTTASTVNRLGLVLTKLKAKSRKAFNSIAVKKYNSNLRKTSSLVKKIATGFGLYLGLSQAINIGTDSLTKFNVQAKSDAQLVSALTSTNHAAGRSYEQLAAQADLLQGKTLFGDEATQEVQAMLLTFKNVRTEMFDQSIPAILDMATAMKVDGKSAAIQLGKALNDPKANLSAMSRSGIQFTEVQKKQINAYQETNQLAKAQAIILNEVNSQFKGSAEAAANSGTGKWTQFMNTVGDIQEVMGSRINTLRNRFVDFMMGIIQNAQPIIKAWDQLKMAFSPLLPAIQSFLIALGLFSAETSASGAAVSFMSTIISNLASVLEVVINGIEGTLFILEPLAPVIKAVTIGIVALKVAFFILNVVMAANPVVLITIAIVAFIGVIVTAYKKVGWFRGAIKGAFEGIKQFGTVLKDHVIENFRKVISGLSGVAKAIQHIFKGEWSEAWEVGKESVKTLGTGMVHLVPVSAAVAVYKKGKSIGEAVQKGYRQGQSEADENSAVKKSAAVTLANPSGIPNLANSQAKSISEGITTGGKKQHIYNIQIDKVLENVTQHISEGKDSADEIVDMVLDGLTRRLGGTFQTVGR